MNGHCEGMRTFGPLNGKKTAPPVIRERKIVEFCEMRKQPRAEMEGMFLPAIPVNPTQSGDTVALTLSPPQFKPHTLVSVFVYCVACAFLLAAAVILTRPREHVLGAPEIDWIDVPKRTTSSYDVASLKPAARRALLGAILLHYNPEIVQGGGRFKEHKNNRVKP